MNVNWNFAASLTQWGNQQTQSNRTETTGAIASRNTDSMFNSSNTETAGAIAMFSSMGGAAQDSSFMAVA